MLDKRKITDNLNKVCELAESIVSSVGGSRIDTTHIVLSMINVECGAGRILRNFGLNMQNFKTTVQKSNSDVLSFAGELTRAFDFAEQLREQSRAVKAGTEHLLLAILTGETLASQKLKQDGFDVKKMISVIAQKLDLEDILPDLDCLEENEQEEDIGPLAQFGYSMTERARQGKLDPTVGRQDEIDRMIRILCRRTKNNPILTGEAGVGKSAVVEGLCALIVNGDVPEPLQGKIIFSLDLAGLLAGTRFRGEFEQKFRNAIEYIQKDKRIILFVDEIHNLVGAGSTGDSKMDAVEILKPLLARGELQTIGATTADEYRKYISKDPALERRFQVVNVEQPTVEQTVEILKGIREKYETHHDIVIKDEALVEAARLSDRYITDRYLPDKAVDVIDESASKVRLGVPKISSEIAKTEETIRKLTIEKNVAEQNGIFAEADYLKVQLAELAVQLNALKCSSLYTKPVVTEEVVAQTISQWTGIPVDKLSESESEKLLNLEKTLSANVIGQEEAVHAVSTAIRRARAGLKDPKRPIGSFIFVGSTGVGKTELCKSLAKNMFGDEKDIITIDMSEYGEQNSISKLIGAPPGFVGFEESGQLTEKVRRKPYSIVLFDEIEKAHRDIFNIFLQILDEGRLTDNRGRVVDFKNTIIIMTSNVGADLISDSFETISYEQQRQIFMSALKKTFRPEFLNRVDDIIVFHPLTFEATRKIAELFTRQLSNRLKENGLRVEFTASALDLLTQQGYSAEYGARPLKRVIQRMVEDKLSEALIAGKIKKGDNIIIDGNSGKILFRK